MLPCVRGGRRAGQAGVAWSHGANATAVLGGAERLAEHVNATANPVQVVVAEADGGRGILGVLDGVLPKGVEGEEDIAKRKDFLRMIGYKG